MTNRPLVRWWLRGLVVLLLGACSAADEDMPPGSLAGADAIRRYGCGTCHIIPGIEGALGTVGPSLAGVARRVYLAGRLPNTPDTMAQWISNPQRFVPGSAMPDMQVSLADARAIASFLGRRR